MTQSFSPYKLYTPSIREPLPLRRKPFILPVPPEAGDKPPKLNWLQILLPPFIMLIVLSVVAALMRTPGFIVYGMAMMVIYPVARVITYIIQKSSYEKEESKRAAQYTAELQKAEDEIVSSIRNQRENLKREFPSTEGICKLAESQGKIRRLWYRTNAAMDFLELRVGAYDGKPSFDIQLPSEDANDLKDPLLKVAKLFKKKFEVVEKIPYLLPLRDIGSLAIQGENHIRYGLTRRLLLDIIVHHRPDEVEIYVLSNQAKAGILWSWLRWAPHCKVFDPDRQFDHLRFGNQAVKLFLGQFEAQITKHPPTSHLVFVVDVDGIQQFDDNFINLLNNKARQWNISLLFVGGEQVPRSVRGVLRPKDETFTIFIDTKMQIRDKDEKEHRALIHMDKLPEIRDCERVTRSLAELKLLSSSGDALLSPNVTLFDVLQIGRETRFTFDNVIQRWKNSSEQSLISLPDTDLLQFPIGLIEENSALCPYSLNLLDANLGGKDAYHTMLIGTTGSGKSEFIKSLILAAAYKYPPQYLSFFCMDFKGGSTVYKLSSLPHMVGVMTNLDEVSAQRGLIAIRYEIDRRQKEFENENANDIWEYNSNRSPETRMPHLLLIIDEFTRGLDLLNDPEFNLQDLLEKRLVPQGRSLGIYLLLANQVANAKAMKLLPNIGWRIILRVASKEQMQFIDSGLKPPKDKGRGYAQVLGEDPVEFQAGYSRAYVQYTDLKIQPDNISIKELLPDGQIRVINEVPKSTEDNETDPFLQMNQMLNAISAAQKKLEIDPFPWIYQKPLDRKIFLEKCGVEEANYRKLNPDGWEMATAIEHLLRAPVGFADLVQTCSQRILVLDFMRNSPHLLLVGSQTDISMGLRSILFSLLLSHSPDDLQIYMMEFGKGLRDIPSYPHIGDLILEDETEKIARCIEYFEAEFILREQNRRATKDKAQDHSSHLFLIINNIAGLKDNVNLYGRIMRFVQQESNKYGIHIILTALPRATGTRVQSTDLKQIKSRIVFPSINPEEYWYYFDMPEHRLVKLTKMDKSIDENGEPFPPRAHYICLSDPQFSSPVEIQVAVPSYKGEADTTFAARMNEIPNVRRPQPISILESKYTVPNQLTRDRACDEVLPIGIQWLNLQEYTIPLSDLPPIWGVSGPRASGKTNFLTLIVDWLRTYKAHCLLDVFTPFSNCLSNYCSTNGCQVALEPQTVLERLTQIEAEDFDASKTSYMILDDLNLYWERDNTIYKSIIETLGKLSNKIYRTPNVMLITSFNYSQTLKYARSRDALIRHLHDNKTGLCLSYDGEWLINSTDLANYKKKLDGVAPAGRGVFVFKGIEKEVQTFWHQDDQ